MFNHDVAGLTGGGLQGSAPSPELVQEYAEKANAARAAEMKSHQDHQQSQLRLQCLVTALNYFGKDTAASVKAARQYFAFATGAPMLQEIEDL